MITPGADSHDSYFSSLHARVAGAGAPPAQLLRVVEPVVERLAVVVAQRQFLARKEAC